MSFRTWIVAAVAVAVPALVGSWLLHGRPVAQQSVAPVAVVLPSAVQPVAIAAAPPVQVVEATATNRPMPPAVAPVGEMMPTPIVPKVPEPDLAPAPPDRQVAIGFSGNVIGETDPCG
ncbi:MAG: hypothetical protein ACOYOB_11720 [Myxococcota bacterium]